VSKKFGEWYQKTNQTEDTNKLTLLAFKIITILHNTLLATFIKLLENVSKGLCRNRSQNRCHTVLDCRHVCKRCAFHDALQAGNQKDVRRRQIRIHPFCEQSSQGMRPGAASSIGIQAAIDGMAFIVFNATQKESLAKVKTMLIAFFDSNSIIHKEFVPAGSNREFCILRGSLVTVATTHPPCSARVAQDWTVDVAA